MLGMLAVLVTSPAHATDPDCEIPVGVVTEGHPVGSTGEVVVRGKRHAYLDRLVPEVPGGRDSWACVP